MKLDELKLIVLKSASNAMKSAGEDIFNNGLVTYFKGKKVDDVYHLYGRVKDKEILREFNTHIGINLQKKSLKGVECTCDEFKEFASGGYTFMCSHITATAYKFFSLVSKNKNESNQEPINKGIGANKKQNDTDASRLVRKIDKDSVYYEGQISSGSERIILKPNELKGFLDKIENRKIKFKFDYIEFTVPILHKDLPVTFNLKEDKDRIVLTTHKQLPVPLNSNNDVYYFKNEIYLPPKEQVERYAPLHERLKIQGVILYKKDINNYNRIISLLSSITRNINISESLRSFASDFLKPEFLVFEEKGRFYCDVYLNYGDRKINITAENKGTDILLRDIRKEEKLIMEIEKYSFAKFKNRFIFTGNDEKLFNLLSGRGDSIRALGKVVLGKGVKGIQLYNSDSIQLDLDETEGYYDFSYSLGDLENSELHEAFEAYRAKDRFYKTGNKGFIDFEDENIRNFFNVFEVLNIEEIEKGSVKIERCKAFYLYENIKNKNLGFKKDIQELEDIEARLLDLNNKEIEVPQNFKGVLREYQIKGYKWLKTLSELGFGGILADEMGLGKTIQTIAFLLSEQNKKTFMVCPTSLIYNWKEEFHRFAPSLKVLTLHGSERNDVMENIDEYDVLLTTYGTLRLDADKYSHIIFDYCIIDEGQNIKNAAALNTRVTKEIKAKTRFALTGTPIENNLSELWSIFDFVMPGYLYSKEKFEDKFILKREDNFESLRNLIKPFILRRTKKEVITELPDKIEKKFLVEMSASQKAVYSNFIKKARTYLKKSTAGKIEIFSYMTKLRQICLDPSLVVEDYNGESSKLEVAIGLIKDHIDFGGKLLLFSQFTSVLDKVGDRLEQERIEYLQLDGRTNPKDRVKRVKEFNNSDSVKVFLISLKAGGTGLNLTSANLVIHFDPWWNPAVEDQATDRAHRIGQNNVVEVIKLVSRGTIEEKIILLQEDKKELIQNILTGEFQNSDIMGNLTKEDLLELLERD